MLSIQIRDNGYSVIGHAEFGQYGQDILCSAVSFVTQSVAGELRKYVEITESKESGMMSVKLLTKSSESKVLLEYLGDSLELLSKMYPNHIKYEKI